MSNKHDANIRDIDGLGWIATIDHEYEGQARVIYALGNTRMECVERFKQAIVFYNDYFWNGPLGGVRNVK